MPLTTFLQISLSTVLFFAINLAMYLLEIIFHIILSYHIFLSNFLYDDEGYGDFVRTA